MSETDDLKPCPNPNCKHDKPVELACVITFDMGPWFGYCNSCGLCAPNADTKDEAARLWNAFPRLTPEMVDLLAKAFEASAATVAAEERNAPWDILERMRKAEDHAYHVLSFVARSRARQALVPCGAQAAKGE